MPPTANACCVLFHILNFPLVASVWRIPGRMANKWGWNQERCGHRGRTSLLKFPPSGYVRILQWKLTHLTSPHINHIASFLPPPPQDQVNHLQQQNQELRRRSMSPRESGPASGTFSHSASPSPRRPLSYELEHPLTGKYVCTYVCVCKVH